MIKLYVFLRSDMSSLTPGKACAQVAHAASQAAFMFRNHYQNDLYSKWESEASSAPIKGNGEDYVGFGTTIVLDVGTEINLLSTIRAINNVPSVDAVYSGIVRDPSYPVRDGSVTHYIDIPTCAWALVGDGNESIREIIKDFKLYNGNHQ